MKLPIKLQKQIIDFLGSLPIIYNGDGQLGLIYEAGLDQELQNQIPVGKPLSQFLPIFVRLLTDYGKLNDGRYALESFLEVTKNHIGQDKRAYCDALLQAVFNFRQEQHSVSRGVIEIIRLSNSFSCFKRYRLEFFIFVIAIVFIGISWYSRLLNHPIILLNEQFDDNKQEWNIGYPENWSAIFAQGQYVISSKQDSCSSSSWISEIDMPNNLSVELTSSWKAGVNNTVYGFFIGVNQKYYAFLLTGQGDAYIGQHIYNGGGLKFITMPSQNRKFPSDGTISNIQRVTVLNNTFEYTVNGKFVGRVSDKIGIDKTNWHVAIMFCGKQRIAFDQLRVMGQ